MATQPRQRAVRSDSLRNRDAILEAAASCLTGNPTASLADIAQAAGVGRVTLYGHFGSREELLGALLHRSMARVESELSTIDLDGDPWQALYALTGSSWRLLHELEALRGVVEQSLPARDLAGSHADPRARVENLIARGRSEGSFRTDQGVDWQVACYYSLLHGAAAEVRAARLREDQAPALLASTIRALLAPLH